MQQLLVNALIAIASRLDLFALAEAIYRMLEPKIPAEVKMRINTLVRTVDELDLPGEEKFREVITALKDPNSSVRGAIAGIPQRVLLVAIQAAYERMEK